MQEYVRFFCMCVLRSARPVFLCMLHVLSYTCSPMYFNKYKVIDNDIHMSECDINYAIFI